MLASNKAVATTVAQTPGAIGYVGLGYLSSDVKALSVNGVDPTRANVISGDYPLARSLFMYTNGKPQGLAKEFIDFILSPAGQKIVEEQGFVSIK
jgi:phosphate transport system substrate-binding protein